MVKCAINQDKGEIVIEMRGTSKQIFREWMSITAELYKAEKDATTKTLEGYKEWIK